MQTCPTCRFIIPEGATECRVCRGDTRASVVETARSAAGADGRRAPRTSTSRLGRFRRRAADSLARNRRHLLLTLASLAAVVATTLAVTPQRPTETTTVVRDVPAADTLAWATFAPEGDALRLDLPGTPVAHHSETGNQYRLDLGPLVLVVGSVPLGTPLPDPLGYLRTVAARTAETLHAGVAERAAVEHGWGPGLDVRIDAKDAVVFLHLTVAGDRLYVIEGDFVPALADRPDSEAVAVYERALASFSPAG